MELNEILCNSFLDYCAGLAHNSNCVKRHFGAVVVPTSRLFFPSMASDVQGILGSGFNYSVKAKPGQDCVCIRSEITSGTRLECCYAIHAEQMAICRSLETFGRRSNANPIMNPLAGYSIVIASADIKTGEQLYRDKPGFYCTLCSRQIKFVGLDGYLGRSEDGLHYMTADETLENSYLYAFEGETVSYGRPGEKIH